jgi:hypothetical protein
VDARYLDLLEKYRQVRPGPPWERIEAWTDAELHGHLNTTRELREEFPPDTKEHVIGGGVIGGWIAQALMIRRFRREHPELT